jgi:hypothetical protein
MFLFLIEIIDAKNFPLGEKSQENTESFPYWSQPRLRSAFAPWLQYLKKNVHCLWLEIHIIRVSPLFSSSRGKEIGFSIVTKIQGN